MNMRCNHYPRRASFRKYGALDATRCSKQVSGSPKPKLVKNKPTPGSGALLPPDSIGPQLSSGTWDRSEPFVVEPVEPQMPFAAPSCSSWSTEHELHVVRLKDLLGFFDKGQRIQSLGHDAGLGSSMRGLGRMFSFNDLTPDEPR